MAYKTANTTATVQLIALRHLDPDTHALCDTLRREAGCCWSDLVQAHVAARGQGIWLAEADLNALTSCSATVNRDANGGANICSRAMFGCYGRVWVVQTTYRHACDVVVPRTRARDSCPVAARR